MVRKSTPRLRYVSGSNQAEFRYQGVRSQTIIGATLPRLHRTACPSTTFAPSLSLLFSSPHSIGPTATHLRGCPFSPAARPSAMSGLPSLSTPTLVWPTRSVMLMKLEKDRREFDHVPASF